jgi:hypothetical protein
MNLTVIVYPCPNALRLRPSEGVHSELLAHETDAGKESLNPLLIQIGQD